MVHVCKTKGEKMPKLRPLFSTLGRQARLKLKLAFVLIFLLGSFIATPVQPVSAAVPYCSTPTFNASRYRSYRPEVYVQAGYTMSQLRNSPGVCREATLEFVRDSRCWGTVMTMEYYVDGELMAFKEHTNLRCKRSRSWGGW